MIIPNQPEVYTFCYLPRVRHRGLALFFPGANVAYRRKALVPLAYFDERFQSGEDTDVGVRLVQKGELFSNPKAKVVHTSNLPLRKLIEQWFRIAVYTVRVFYKYANLCFEVFMRGLVGDSRYRQVCLCELTIPLTAVIFVSPFLLLNVGLWGVVASLGHPLAVAFALFTGLVYFWSDFARTRVSLRRLLLYAGLRFAINLILLHVSFAEGLRNRMFYVNYELDGTKEVR